MSKTKGIIWIDKYSVDELRVSKITEAYPDWLVLRYDCRDLRRVQQPVSDLAVFVPSEKLSDL